MKKMIACKIIERAKSSSTRLKLSISTCSLHSGFAYRNISHQYCVYVHKKCSHHKSLHDAQLLASAWPLRIMIACANIYYAVCTAVAQSLHTLRAQAICSYCDRARHFCTQRSVVYKRNQSRCILTHIFHGLSRLGVTVRWLREWRIPIRHRLWRWKEIKDKISDG